MRPVKAICFLSQQKGCGSDSKETSFHGSVSRDNGGLVDGLTGLGVADVFDAGQFPAWALVSSRNSHCLMEEPECIQLEKKSTRTTFQPKGKKKKDSVVSTPRNIVNYFRNIKE